MLSFTKYLLIWDACKCHTNEAVKAETKWLCIDTAIVPGGCTKFIQATNVACFKVNTMMIGLLIQLSMPKFQPWSWRYNATVVRFMQQLYGNKLQVLKYLLITRDLNGYENESVHYKLANPLRYSAFFICTKNMAVSTEKLQWLTLFLLHLT